MKRFLLAASTALLLTACDVGMDPAMDTLDMPEVADGTLSEDTMKRVTERLSSDEFEGRAPGTPGVYRDTEERDGGMGLQRGARTRLSSLELKYWL